MRFAFALTLCSSLLFLGCSHMATLDRGGCAVEFHGARLNGSPVQVETIEEGGHEFVVEKSVFVYEITPPFQSFQAIASISPADRAAPWNVSGADLSSAFAQLLAQMTKALPNARCEAPRPDAALDQGGLESLCKASDQGMTYSMRLRVVPGSRGVLLQVASWTGEKGQAWTDAFWSSLHATGPAPAATGAPASTPIPVGALASRFEALTKR